MLFNSYEFIFLYLPLVMGIYFALGRRHDRAALGFLLLASWFFYGFWDVRYLPLLVVSIAGNYLISGLILRAEPGSLERRLAFLLGLCFDLGLLGYYKYLDFFIANLDALTGWEIALRHNILPLGISFFTITQLLYLVDCQAGLVKERKALEYALFVSFFPHLLAGPILYHRQMMAQLADPRCRRFGWENFSRGLALFIIGLAKKVLIADAFIGYVGMGFGAPQNLHLLDGWLTAIAYMLQLYFDFSGYSDMAMGLSRMLGYEIPVNFNAPYRAKNVIAFWQRWHMSLTQALTACVYMPLARRFRQPTFAKMTMASAFTLFVVGIWHGAGWTYVVFAALQALGITVSHIWKKYSLPCPGPLAHLLTLAFIAVSMVIFRAPDLHAAGLVLKAMAGGQALALPNIDALPLAELLAGLALVAFARPSQELAKKLPLRPVWLLVLTLLFLWSVLHLYQISDFLYFQF